MDQNQVLKIGIYDLNLRSGWHFFYLKMGKDGRILIPKLTLTLLRSKDPSLAGHIMNITIEPAEKNNQSCEKSS